MVWFLWELENRWFQRNTHICSNIHTAFVLKHPEMADSYRIIYSSHSESVRSALGGASFLQPDTLPVAMSLSDYQNHKRTVLYPCDCGGNYPLYGRYMHERTAEHQVYACTTSTPSTSAVITPDTASLLASFTAYSTSVSTAPLDSGVRDMAAPQDLAALTSLLVPLPMKKLLTTCVCGGQFLKKGQSIHERSVLHRAFVQNLESATASMPIGGTVLSVAFSFWDVCNLLVLLFL